MTSTKSKGRLFFFLILSILLILGGPALAAEEEAPAEPTVILRAQTFTYNGEVQYLSLEDLYHPEQERGHYSFAWYKNGELLPSASERIQIRTVSDSGMYYCKVTFTLNGKTSEKTTDTVQITVQKQEVSVPVIPSMTYTGYQQFPTLYSTEHYEVSSNEGALAAGEYYVRLRLLDTENTAFPAGVGEVSESGEYLSLSYTVERADNAFTTEPSILSFFEGGAPAPRAFARFGEVRYLYYADAEGRVEIAPPRGVGTYYVRAVVDGSESVNFLSSPLLSFEIKPLTVSALRLLSPPERLSYLAFENFSLAGLSLVATMADGTTRTVPTEQLRIEYPRAECLLYGDREVRVFYGDACLPIPVVTSRVPLSFSSAVFSESGWVYDGVEREITVSGLPQGVIVSSYTGNVICSAGTYTVCAHLSFDRENYEGPSVLSHTVTVQKQALALPSLLPKVYNGSVQSPTFTDLPLYRLEEIPSALRSGVYYAIVRLTDPENYCFEGIKEDCASIPFEILPLAVKVEIDNTVLYFGDEFSIPPYRVVSGTVIGGDDLRICYREEGGSIRYYFQNSDYSVTYEGGAVERVYRLPKAAESAILLGATALLLLVLLIFALILLYKKRIKPTAGGEKAPFVTYPMFTRERKERTYDPSYRIEEHPAPSLSEPEEKAEEIPEKMNEGEEEGTVEAVDVKAADALITDALAEALLMTEEREIYTEGSRRGVINVDTLSAAFLPGDEVDINRLKKKKLIARDVGYIKVLARGSIDKPLTVYADDFSLGAIKMIALTGGRTFHVKTRPLP